MDYDTELYSIKIIILYFVLFSFMNNLVYFKLEISDLSDYGIGFRYFK